MSRSGPRISERLRAVSSASELHEVLSALAADLRGRWRRAQVLYYLPSEYHPLAEDYFQGDHLVVPRRRTAHTESVDLVAWEEALAELDRLARTFPSDEKPLARVQPPLLDECKPGAPTGPDDVMGQVSWALLNEARATERAVPKRFRLKDGRCIGVQGESFVYLFVWSSEAEPHLPGKLQIDRERSYAARVGNQGEEPKTFELLTDEYLGPSISEASFWIDPTFLLRVQLHWLQGYRVRGAYRSQIASLLHGPEALASEVDDSANSSGRGLNTRQRQALAAARSARVSYVWGPPGTGKTRTLGALVRERVNAGERLLVLSPYNIAVDQAVVAAHSWGEWQRGQIVRFGRVSQRIRDLRLDMDSVLEWVAEKNDLLRAARRLHAAVAHIYEAARPTPATVRRCIEELGEVVVRVGRGGRAQDGQAARIMDGIRLLRRLYRSPERNLLRDAQVMATTVTMSQLSPMVHAQRFDRVIVDEASVMRTPEAILAALMFDAPVTFFGDPMQLPAVSRTRGGEAEQWLRANPFRMAGIQGPEQARGSCVLLNQQHRMAIPIRRLVSDLFYNGALEDAEQGREGRILLLDTSKTPARSTTRWVRMSRSRENQVHRDVTASLLGALRRDCSDGSVLILAPFRAQARAYAREAATNRFRRVRFETVHTSQGSEADTVVLDFVLAPSRGKSRFLDDSHTTELRNLLNVGISRAKRQLIIIAHVEEVRKQYPGGLVARLLQRAAELGKEVELPADLRLHSTWTEILDGGPGDISPG